MVETLESNLTLFGLPKQLVTDRGSNFTDSKVSALMKRLRIEHHLIATGASRANGAMKLIMVRFVGTNSSLFISVVCIVGMDDVLYY